MKLDLAKPYVKHFKALSVKKKKQVLKALELFVENPRHPSLHFEVLKSAKAKKNSLHTIRINVGDGILLLCLIHHEHYVILDVGTHDEIYKKAERL